MDEALQVLNRIARGVATDSSADMAWIHAFTTVGWVVQGSAGPILTPEGVQGHRDLARPRPPGSDRRRRALQLVD